MDHLAKDASEIALRLAKLSADPKPHSQAVDELEQLALKILKAVSAVRAGSAPSEVGENSGMWRAVQSIRRQ